MSASSNQVPNKSVVAFAWCSDMAKQVSLTYQRIQLVLRAKSTSSAGARMEIVVAKVVIVLGALQSQMIASNKWLVPTM